MEKHRNRKTTKVQIFINILVFFLILLRSVREKLNRSILIIQNYYRSYHVKKCIKELVTSDQEVNSDIEIENNDEDDKISVSSLSSNYNYLLENEYLFSEEDIEDQMEMDNENVMLFFSILFAFNISLLYISSPSFFSSYIVQFFTFLSTF